jgi:chromate reductase
MKILAISGSLRADSYNTSLLHTVAEAAPAGIEVELWEGIGDLPIYDQDLESGEAPTSVRRLREDWAAADAILFATPEYNGSVPGGLKNAIDWASRPATEAVLRNKPVAVIGASTGMFGAVWAQAELRKALATAGARVIDRELPVPSADEAFDDDGALGDHDLTLELEGILAELLDSARRRQAA